MMFLSPIFNPDFLSLAHPLYNECLFYHVGTLFLNSNYDIIYQQKKMVDGHGLD